MSKKYIVTNCPNMETNEYYLRGKLITERICTSDQEELRLCQNCTNCIIKQVVEKCREELGICYNDIDQGRNYLANEILQLFTIQEVE